MSLPIPFDQTVVISALSESIYNNDTDYVLSITPDIFSPTGYSDTKAKIQTVSSSISSSYSITSSYSYSSSLANSASVSLTSSYTTRALSASYASQSFLSTTSSYSAYALTSNSSSYSSESLHSINSDSSSFAFQSEYAKSSSWADTSRTASVYIDYQVTASVQVSASWASSSVSSSYATYAISANSSSNSISSSYSPSASYASVASQSILADTASVATTTRAITEKFIVSNPMTSIADGDYHYIVQYNTYMSQSYLLRRSSTGEVIYLAALPSSSTQTCPPLSFPPQAGNMTRVKSDQGDDFITYTSTNPNGGHVYLYCLSGSKSGSLIFRNTTAMNAYSMTSIDDSGSNSFGYNKLTFPTFHHVTSWFDITSNPATPDPNQYAISCIANQWASSESYNPALPASSSFGYYGWLDFTPSGQILNFSKYGTTSLCTASRFDTYTALEKTIENCWNGMSQHYYAQRIIYFWYNQHPNKRRMYLVTNGTGLMHIFNIKLFTGSYNPSDSMKLIDWLGYPTNPSQFLTYEKTITINGGDAYWKDYNKDSRYTIDVDVGTGRERYITVNRRGDLLTQGTITRVPWPETS